jgi:hypothetical protein
MDELKQIQPSQPLPARTTEQEDMTKAGQRRINLIWEVTQGLIALMITAAIIYLQVNKIEGKVLEYAFVAIITMYYVRTNHQLIGGTGSKPFNEQR